MDGKNFVCGQKEVEESKTFRVEQAQHCALRLSVERHILDTESLPVHLCRSIQVW